MCALSLSLSRARPNLCAAPPAPPARPIRDPRRAASKDVHIVAFLLSYGADKHKRDKAGRTPQDYAQLAGQPFMASMLR